MYKYIIVILLLIISYTICMNKSKNSISTSMANQDLTHMKNLLYKESPYYKLNKTEFNKIYELFQLENKQKKEIPINTFIFQLETLLGTLKDQHISYKLEKKYENSKLYLPFPIAPYKDSLIVALKEINNSEYEFQSLKHPFIKKINGIDINKVIIKTSPINKYSTKYAFLTKGVEGLQELKNLSINNKIKITLTSYNFKNDTTILYSPSKIKYEWKEKKYTNIQYKNINNTIAYIGIPKMINRKENEKSFKEIYLFLEKFRSTKALIIDIRNNGGGNRDLIHFFSNYLLPPHQSSIVNIGFLNPQNINNQTIKELSQRKMINLNNDNLSNYKKINSIIKNIKTNIPKEYNYIASSSITSDNNKQYYNKPVYILVNENTYSAASIFASVFKDIPNITIVGVTPNSSSGLSKIYNLKVFRLKFSTMLSFQKNSLLFDGVGTIPDIIIERSLDNLLKGYDNQLQETINIINNKAS